MSVDAFIPELWTASILDKLRSKLVFGQAGVVNRDYEGQISQRGDTVHILNLDDVTVADYGSGALDYEDLNGSDLTLTIDQAKSFAFSVDDIDAVQSNVEYRGRASQSAARGLAQAADTFLAGLMVSGAASGNKISTPASGLDASGAVDLLLQLAVKLDEADVPSDGRFAVVSPGFAGQLLRSPLFVDAASRGDQSGRTNGAIGEVFGFNVMKTNAYAKNGTKETVTAGHPMATSYAEQIIKTEALRSIDRFEDLFRGLHVYGGKVVIPEALAVATLS